MTKKELMIQAHEMTREIKAEYPAVDYNFQLGLCMSYLLNEGDDKMEETIITWDTIAKKADEYCAEYSGDWYADWHVNNWKKGEHDRSYIEIREYRKGRLKCTKKCGFWDNIKNEYNTFDRYTKVLDLLNA